MSDFKLGLGITTGMDTQTLRWLTENADRLGANSVWIGEDIGKGPDVFVLAAATLMRTESARVGTAIVPVVTHDFLALARAIATLGSIAPDRFVFGTGIGGLQDLERLKIEVKKPVTLLRESVHSLKRLWAGAEVSIDVPPVCVENGRLRYKVDTGIPIFLGVRGPQMLKLAGEVADGVVLSGPKDYIKWAINRVHNASVEAGRHKDSVEIIVWNPTIPFSNESDEDLARKIVALIVSDTPKSVLDMLRVDHEQVDEIIRVTREGGVDKGAEIVDRDMLDVFCIAGTPEQMVGQFEALGRMGVSEILVGPPFSGEWRDAVQTIFGMARNY